MSSGSAAENRPAIAITGQLQSLAYAEREQAEELLRQILPELHRIATRELRRERYMAPCSPTELINETWIRSLHKGGWTVKSRSHFYALAARAMRQVLVDFARRRLAQRRNADQPADRNTMPDPATIVEIDLLLESLKKVDRSAAVVFEMHYFVGYTFKEIAEVTRLSPRQVRYLWTQASKWMASRLR